MRVKLNKNQVKFMLEHWFDAYEIYKIFDTNNMLWLLSQKFELDTSSDWPDVIMNGEVYTTINARNSDCAAWLKELLNITD